MSPSAERYLATGRDEDLPVIDAHHHIWDLQRNHHPWLADEPPAAFAMAIAVRCVATICPLTIVAMR